MEAYAKFEDCREENAIKYITRYEDVANEYDRRILRKLLLKYIHRRCDLRLCL